MPCTSDRGIYVRFWVGVPQPRLHVQVTLMSRDAGQFRLSSCGEGDRSRRSHRCPLGPFRMIAPTTTPTIAQSSVSGSISMASCSGS